MKVKECLLKKTTVGDIVIFTDGGWQIGMTQIDNEDLFIQSLNPTLLDKEVKNVSKEYKQLYSQIDLKFKVTVIKI